MRSITPFILFLSLSAISVCITACGQKGALYLPQNNQAGDGVVETAIKTVTETANKTEVTE